MQKQMGKKIQIYTCTFEILHLFEPSKRIALTPHTHTHRETGRHTDRQTDRQTDRETDRQTEIHAHTHIHTCMYFPLRIGVFCRCYFVFIDVRLLLKWGACATGIYMSVKHIIVQAISTNIVSRTYNYSF